VNVIIVSDDLSGSAGVASMIGINVPVIPFRIVHKIYDLNFPIVSVDLETRNNNEGYQKIAYIKNTFHEFLILARIDSLLRGSTKEFIEFMAEDNKLLITDTIPEYKRYTFRGYSMQNDTKHDLAGIIPEKSKNNAAVMDSSTYEDLRNLARKCIEEDYLPADPGLMIKFYLEMI
jgi:uncharacterized protein YgbK (DUF1537 family)